MSTITRHGAGNGAPSMTEAGGILHSSGLLPIREGRARIPEGIEQQAALALGHMDALLTQAGLHHHALLMLDIQLTCLERDYARLLPVLEARFKDGPRPAQRIAGVASLPDGCLIQLSFNAAR
jgi:enamine deaminase RidA (YjgF/YER057c/UK114 family)